MPQKLHPNHTTQSTSSSPTHTLTMEEIGAEKLVEPLARPSWMELVDTASTVVDGDPDESVTISVTAVGAGVIKGSADAFIVAVGAPTRIGLYVLTPSSESASCPMVAGTDVLKT